MEQAEFHLLFFSGAGYISTVSALCLGVFIWLRNKSNIVNRTAFFLTFSTAIWSFGLASEVIAPLREIGLFWSRFLHAGVIFIPIAYFHFISSLIGAQESKKFFIAWGYIFSVILSIFNLLGLVVVNVSPKGFFNYYTDPGIFYPLLLSVFFLFVSYAIYFLLKRFREYEGLKKRQLAYMILASIFGFGGGSLTFLPVFNISNFSVLIGQIIVIFYPIFVGYGILRYHLMDIRVGITRAGIFLVIYTSVLGFPFWVGYFTKSWFITGVLMFILATTGPFIYSYFQRKAEKRLRKEEFEAHQALNRLAQNMMRYTDLRILLKLIAHHVVKIMKVSFASIYLRDEGNKHYLLRAAWGPDNPPPPQSEFLEDTSLVKDVLLRRVTIVSEELSFGRTSKVSPHLKRLQLELHKAKAAVVIPAFKGEYLFGFLMLGARRDKRLFTQEDLNLLMLLANQSVLAIENAQLFEKEKTLLAEKSRRDALADMAPGVAHQFNNRLMSITTIAELQKALLEQEDAKKLDPEKLSSLIDQTKNALDSIVRDAMRGKDIADAILKKGRAKLIYIETDLAPIIQSSIELLRLSRTRKSLEGAPEPEIILNAEDNLPKLILNESLIQDIFYNIIDNARDAIIIMHRYIQENKFTPGQTSYRGKITITVYKKDNEVIVTVHDNGIGMDEKTKARLFVPYFTTKATSLKGTGMGLWVIRSFIEDHKGRISFESEYTRGTTFTIAFPISPKIQGYEDGQQTLNR